MISWRPHASTISGQKYFHGDAGWRKQSHPVRRQPSVVAREQCGAVPLRVRCAARADDPCDRRRRRRNADDDDQNVFADERSDRDQSQPDGLCPPQPPPPRKGGKRAGSRAGVLTLTSLRILPKLAKKVEVHLLRTIMDQKEGKSIILTFQFQNVMFLTSTVQKSLIPEIRAPTTYIIMEQ